MFLFYIRGVTPNECPENDTKLSDGAGALGNVKYPFNGITLRFTLTWGDSTC